MAIKIPDAPGIIGSEPVLRSPEGVNGATATPNFQINTRPIVDVTNQVGTLLANVNQERIDGYMTAASLWWTENMNKRMREVQDTYKGAAAMDLYVREIKPFAEKLTENVLGAPKDDGVVRIANPELQKAFKKWTDGQLRSYNAQIGNYEGRELAAYNESVYTARQNQITEGLLQATTPEEVVGYSKSMLDLSRVRNRGRNKDYIEQVAQKQVDDAVTANVLSKGATDIQVGYSYYTDPQIQAVLSSASKSKILTEFRKDLVEQGAARGGEALANGDPSVVAWYSGDEIIRQIYATDNPNIIRGVQLEIQGKAQDRADALKEKAAGVQSQINAGFASQIANVQTDEEFGQVLQGIAAQDQRWALQLDNANQRDALDAASVKYVTTFMPSYASDVATRKDQVVKEINTMYGVDIPEPEGMTEEQMALRTNMINLQNQVAQLEAEGIPHEDAVNRVATQEARHRADLWIESPEQQEIVDRYNAWSDRVAVAGEKYTQMMDKVVSGEYTGGYSEEMNDLPLSMQRDIYAAVATEAQYRKLIDSHPGVDGIFKDVDSSYANLSAGFQERAKRMAMNRVNAWEQKNGDTASGEQLKKLVQQGYADAKDPVSNAMEETIYSNTDLDDLDANAYWRSEYRTDALRDQRIAREVSAAAIPTFSKTEAYSKQSSRTWDTEQKNAGKKIDKLRKALPSYLKPVVDQNRDRYIKWYSVGNTNAIINHINAHRNALQ